MLTQTTITPATRTMKDILGKDEFRLPRTGTIISGVVISVSKSSIMLDLGAAGIGIIYPGQFYDNPDRVRALKPGEEVAAMLLELENDAGYRELSLKAAQLTTAWQRIKELRDTGGTIATVILNINKGGLIVQVEGVQGFLPLSQLSSEHYPRVEGGDTTKIVQALQKYKGQEFQVKVLDYSETEGKLIVSERAIREDAAKGELSKLAVGQEIQGTVTEVTDFGAFVRIGEHLDGLVHSSEMDWKYVEDPRELLHTGDAVTAKIISLDGGRVSLSIKALRPDPWLTVHDHFTVGQTITGTVLKTRTNGAFVSLTDDIVGILPTAEFKGKAPADAVAAGQSVSVFIASIDPKDHKLILTFDQPGATAA